jgi:Tfp pilus assembly protein PilO
VTKRQVPLTPVLAIALVLVAAVGWFGLIGPKQARGAKLGEEIADYELKIALAAHPKPAADAAVVEIDVADIFQLAKAMPDDQNMPGVMLELNAVATSAGISFRSIQPGTPVEHAGYYSVPVTLTLDGNYYDLTDFLFRLRNLVGVADGVLAATGRMYTLDTLEIHESTKGFPEIEAVLTISAYVFGAPPAAPGEAPPAPPAPPPPAATGTTGATTTTPSTAPTTITTTTTNNAMAPLPGAPGVPNPGSDTP